MLLTTQAGIVVNSDHDASIALRREVPSPSEPDPPAGTPPTFRVLLSMAAQVDGTYIVATRGLSVAAARFVREDIACMLAYIAHHWINGAGRWSARESLEAHRQGAYFATNATGDAETDCTDKRTDTAGKGSPQPADAAVAVAAAPQKAR